MVATLVIETSLALYTVWRYKMSVLTRLIVGTLLALATFQLAEYFVCTGVGTSGEQWSRLGFVAIAFLPPLGLHLLHVVAEKPRRLLVLSAYATMAGFIGFFLLHHGTFTAYQCTGNYVIFHLSPQVGGIYYVYYYAWLFISILLGMHWANQLRAKGKAARRRLESTRAMIIGYLVFLVPTTVANTVSPSTKAGIPSIMCGFAVLFGLILALYVLPRLAEQKRDLTLKLPMLLKR